MVYGREQANEWPQTKHKPVEFRAVQPWRQLLLIPLDTWPGFGIQN